MKNEERSMGFFEKLVNIFTSPTKVMEDLKDHPTMLLPLIYGILITAITYFLQLPLIQAKQEDMYRIMSERYGMDLSSQAAVSSNVSGVSGIIGSVVGILIAWIIGGLVYWLISRIFKGKSTLTQILGVNAHVLLLTTSLGLISAALTYVLKLNVDIFSFAILSPTGDMTSFIYNLISMITIYGVWGAIITGIGLSVINQFSRTKGYIVSFIVYALTILMGASSASFTFWMLDMTTKM